MTCGPVCGYTIPRNHINFRLFPDVYPLKSLHLLLSKRTSLFLMWMDSGRCYQSILIILRTSLFIYRLLNISSMDFLTSTYYCTHHEFQSSARHAILSWKGGVCLSVKNMYEGEVEGRIKLNILLYKKTNGHGFSLTWRFPPTCLHPAACLVCTA